ncbi:MAG: dUTP diphosphatase [Deltaproteobacteria bacterium]
MEPIPLKIKKLKHYTDLPMPDYASEGASGMDLRACIDQTVRLAPGDIRLIPTGLAVAIPQGYEAQIRPRSGLALHHGIGMLNSPGTIDSDYRGEVGIILVNWGGEPFTISRGDRIAQMVISKVYRASVIAVEDLDDTPRGAGGFGHSGVK